jgi:peptide/nickel transport system permease protein
MTLAADPEQIARRQAFRRRAFANREVAIGGAIVLLFVLVAVLAPLLAPYDPLQANFLTIRKPPSWAHPFGTDDVGRDVLARVIYGARSSLLAGVVSVSIAVAIGVLFGLAAGYIGGVFDLLAMRLIDAMLAIPSLVLAIALAAFLGPNLTNAMIAIGITATPAFVRLTRAQVMAVKVETYVEAAVSVGDTHLQLLTRHILPNAINPIIVQVTLAISTAIIAEASLSFLGLGQQPPSPSWGSMLNAARGFLSQAPWMAIWPGAAIFVVVVSFNLLGDGLRDLLDPREAATERS